MRSFLTYALVALSVAAAARVFVFAPREVSVAPVATREVTAEVLGTGTVTTRVLPRVGTKITGRVEQVLVDEGEIVGAGDLVAVLEDTDFRHQVERAEARVEAARATEREARRSWERVKKLFARKAVTEEQVDIAEERYEVAASHVRVEEAELRYEQFKLSETKVTTSVAGLVTKRWVDPGDAVVAGQPVVTVADPSTVWVAANLDQRLAGKVKEGQPATVILRGRPDEPFRGEVARVNPQADAVTEELLVEVSFPLPAEELRVGQWAEVYIEVGRVTNTLVVPKPAVLPAGNDRFVFVAGPDGTVRQVKVTPGATSPRLPFVAVSGDLKAGERVILRPIGLKEGDAVRATAPSGTSEPAAGGRVLP